MAQDDKGGHLRAMADALLQPGFVGTQAPDWLLRRIDEGLGGAVLFSRNIVGLDQVAALTAQLRERNPDVIVAVDEEAGDVTRFEAEHGSSRPGNFALGAVDDPQLTEAVARDLGRTLAAAGVTLDYAPDADVNSNPRNPVIGVRSFGADPHLVARHTVAWQRGLQAGGVAACIKHFPGHGDTSVDSHDDLPVVTATREQLEADALVPFRAAVAGGARAVMTGHLLVPALDPQDPGTVSRRIIEDLLRGELGFDGLVITDGIEMGAMAKRYGIAGATVRAIVAGADAICVGGGHADEGTAVLLRDALVEAVITGVLPEERLAEAAARVRAFAEWSAELRRLAAELPFAGDPLIGLTAARRAVRVTAGPATLPLAGPAHVVELAPEMNQAVDKHTAWGIARPLQVLVPGTSSLRLTDDAASDVGVAERILAAAAGRPLVVAVRDAQRHPWMVALLDELIKRREDVVVVEMGAAPYEEPVTVVSTFGGTRVSGQAAAELLAGRTVDELI
ncbi:MAG: beta-N-acetylhexosaminidase [Cryptosporangiaceae bacterium]|nr:beta-N-acetylhexosaminidase [Cryptosporangiaceae bacterium]